MSTVVAGPVPWSESYDPFKYSGKGSRGAKSAQRALGLRWSRKENKWKHNANHGTDRKARWDDYIVNSRRLLADMTDQYKKTGQIYQGASNADYVDYSFNVDKDSVIGIEGCGHISNMLYNVHTLVLQVTFTNNGSVVCYFNVPSTVVGELFNYAETKVEDSMGKHLLGKRFWELVRVKGNIHGSRYPFAYTEDNGFANGEGHVKGARWSHAADDDMDRIAKSNGTTGMSEEEAAAYESAEFTKKDIFNIAKDILDKYQVYTINDKSGVLVKHALTDKDRIELRNKYDKARQFQALNLSDKIKDKKVKELQDYLRSISPGSFGE